MGIKRSAFEKSIGIFITKVCVGNTRAQCRAVPHSLNATNRMHWAEKHRWTKAWQEQVVWLIREKGRVVKPFQYARIEIELRTLQPQDKDNSYASVKALVDATKGFVIEDDNQEQLDLIVTTVKVNHRHEEGVQMRITELRNTWKKTDSKTS